MAGKPSSGTVKQDSTQDGTGLAGDSNPRVIPSVLVLMPTMLVSVGMSAMPSAFHGSSSVPQWTV
jgi:hypothetical protein